MRIIKYFPASMLAVVAVFATSCSKPEEAAPAPAEAAPETSLFNEPLSAPVAAPAPAKDPATVVATVNGKNITQGEVDKEINAMMTRMQGRVPPERLDQMRMQMESQMLNNLISKQVVAEKIAAENIAISDEEYTKALGELTANLPAGATLDVMLAQSGTSEEEFKTSFTEELKFRKLIESQSGGKAEASEAEAQTFYDENKQQFEKAESVDASHILIGFEETDSDEVKAEKKKQLEDIKARIGAGADFAEMAKEHSSCPSKAQGGSLGNFTRGRMVPAFEEAAFSQPVGEVGNIVETQFGYHIIRVDKKVDAGTTPFDEVKDQLVKYLSSQKQQKVAREYVDELVKAATVSYPGQ